MSLFYNLIKSPKNCQSDIRLINIDLNRKFSQDIIEF